jgi:hypothetical protein
VDLVRQDFAFARQVSCPEKNFVKKPNGLGIWRQVAADEELLFGQYFCKKWPSTH